jgi:hypothetical protein
MVLVLTTVVDFGMGWRFSMAWRGGRMLAMPLEIMLLQSFDLTLCLYFGSNMNARLVVDS